MLVIIMNKQQDEQVAVLPQRIEIEQLGKFSPERALR